MEDLYQLRKELILNHLRSKGYPNIHPGVVMQELQTIYQLLGNANLLRGVTYQQFVQEINHATMCAQLHASFGRTK